MGKREKALRKERTRTVRRTLLAVRAKLHEALVLSRSSRGGLF